uniref:Rap guanine nucleotide exchange factor 2 n=1 Tax=Globodera rostochiensis TaxID=31243 RepID=A0A914GUX5_GLORO
MSSSTLFYNALIRRPNERTEEDLSVIFNQLRRLDVFERLHDGPLRSVCRTARLERHPANYVLFRKGQLATCWYILLSGSVFMNKQIYLPIGCFGKRSAGMNLRRMSDCIVISPSEMIVIDYPDVQRITVHLNNDHHPSPATASSSNHSHSPIPFSSQSHHYSLPSCSATANTAISMPTCSTTAETVADHHHHHQPQFHHYHNNTLLMRHRQSGAGGELEQQNMAQSSADRPPHHFLNQHHQQQRLVFHHFPAPLPPPSTPPPPTSSSATTVLSRSPCSQQQQQLLSPQNSQHYHHQRVPSPAPTFSLSPAKLITPILAANQCQHRPSPGHYPSNYSLHHAKSNSLSSDLEPQQKHSNDNERHLGKQQQQQLHHFQHEQWQQQQLPSQRNLRNGGEPTNVEDDGTLDLKRHQNEGGVERSAQQLQQQNCSSANSKTAPSYLKEVMAAGSSSSTVQQKKCLFERKCSSSPSRPLSPTALKRKNSSVEKSPKDVLIVPNAKTTNALAEHGDVNGEGPANAEESAVHGASKNSFASNFHRLSRVRLNMSRKLHQSNSVSSSSEASSSQQQQQQAQNTLNVRIRHQSPHQQQQRQSGRPRAGTPSSISLASNARWPTAATAWTVSSSTTADETDCFAGLPETVVDSDGGGSEVDEDEEEDDEVGSCPSRDSELRDVVRECLEKPPDQRSSEDMAILIEFMDSLPSLAALPMAIKRQLSLKMVFAHVPNKGTVIMQHGERIDAWSVVVNGSVEKLHSDGQRTECQFNDGEIRTMVNDCEFILVEHSEFHAIMSSLSRQIEQEQDKSGMLVLEVERRIITKASPDRLLQQLLVGDESAVASSAGGEEVPTDSHFVEDFLLMHRVFFRDSVQIAHRLLRWFREEPKHRERVARIMLIWLNNHFEDFEGGQSAAQMTGLLDEFDELLANANMFNHQSLLSITVSVKSQPRMITLTRSDRAEELNFQLVGGNNGIFVMSVDPNSAAERAGIKRWDELLEVNGQFCRCMSLPKALDLLRESTHLSISVKTNWIGFKEALLSHQNGGDQADSAALSSPAINPPPPSSSATLRANATGTNCGAVSSAVPSRYQKKSSAPMMGGGGAMTSAQQKRERRSTLCSALQQQAEFEQRTAVQPGAGSITPVGSIGSSNGGGGTLSSKKVLNKLLFMIRGGGGAVGLAAAVGDKVITGGGDAYQMVDSADEFSVTTLSGGSLRASRSNPDISANSVHQPFASCSTAANASSASHRHSSFSTNSGGGGGTGANSGGGSGYFGGFAQYVPVASETTARQLMLMALQEFGLPINESDGWWALYECSVSREGVTKQGRLPDSASNLAERIGLNARLYLRDLRRPEESNLLPDELIPELFKQTRLTLYTLNAQCIAAQLTLQDFAVFATIEPTEYVNNLFQLIDNEDPCCPRHKGWPKLEQFEVLFNREMWWVATEVCCERNVYRRSKLVKKFIKIAKHCQLLRNLNSMFAIISGLEKPAVRRLLHTWERVPGKYLKVLADLQQLMDPSRNMSRYRQHLAQFAQDPPVIPIYPILRKDLIFAHEANPTFCNGAQQLVNFEKLRMIAQIIRNIQRYSSIPYDQSELIGANSITSDRLFDPGTMRKNGGSGGTMGQGSSRFGTSTGGGTVSRKKLYERTMMLMRVKAYLQNIPIIDSEIDLDRISLDCEPPMSSASGASNSFQQQLHYGSSNIPSRRRLPSPSPSSLSSQSNQSSTVHSHDRHRGMISLPKFGVESPQAISKMLSLVQNSKIKSRTLGYGRTVHSKDDLPPSGFDQSKRSSVTSSGENSNNERAIL